MCVPEKGTDGVFKGVRDGEVLITPPLGEEMNTLSNSRVRTGRQDLFFFRF